MSKLKKELKALRRQEKGAEKDKVLEKLLRVGEQVYISGNPAIYPLWINFELVPGCLPECRKRFPNLSWDWFPSDATLAVSCK